MIPVIIPFYKNKAQIEKCLESLNLEPQGTWFYLVEDDSSLGSGFTKTCNRGIVGIRRTNIESPYAILLNQDCFLKKGAIPAMVSFMDSHPRCAIAGIKQLSSRNEDQIIHGGTLECFPAGRHEGGLVSRGDCSESKQVPWVNGACMIVRLEAILEIGLMDENMKMFCSDADWSYTARARGWECWYIAEASCVHEQGVSANMDESMSRTFEQDALYFRSKWIDGELYRDLSLEIFERA